MKNRLTIIEALELARQSQGITQAELASSAGTSRVTVGRIEAGFDPKLSTVYELARALGLELTVVPKSLAGEVQAFLRSGGRYLAQPVGASAPPSVVDLARLACFPAPASTAEGFAREGVDLSAADPQPTQSDIRVGAQPTRISALGTEPRPGLQPLHSLSKMSLMPESTSESLPAEPLCLTKRSSQPSISESAALVLELMKAGKDAKNTKALQ